MGRADLGSRYGKWFRVLDRRWGGGWVIQLQTVSCKGITYASYMLYIRFFLSWKLIYSKNLKVLFFFISKNFFFFDVDHFLKSLLNLLQYCFCFTFWCLFWLWGMWDLSSLTRIEPAPPAVEGEVLTTGLPGKSPALKVLFLNSVSPK